MTLEFFDTHTHLDLIAEKAEQSEEQIWQRARQGAVAKALHIGIDWASSRKALALAHQLDGVLASIGYHPSNGAEQDNEIPQIMDLARRERASGNGHFVAIGEVGLDYYWIEDDKRRQRQREIFAQFISLAVELDKTLVVHCRDGEAESGQNAMEDCRRLLEQAPALPKTIMHCYGGTASQIQGFQELGCYISFAGNVTFKKAQELQQAAKLVPVDHLLIETDAPYLTPVPHRGKRNEPAMVRHTFDFLRELLGQKETEFAYRLWRNSHEAFGLAQYL